MQFKEIYDKLIILFKSRTFYIIVGIALVLLVIMIVILTTLWKKKRARYPNLLKDKHRCSESLIISTSKFPTVKDPYIFTIHVRFYIQDYRYRYGKNKIILRRGLGDQASPSLRLEDKINTAIFGVETQHSVEYIEIPEIEIRKWLSLTFVVNQKHVDCYHNGKLEKIHTLKGLPKLNSWDMDVCPDGGFLGVIDSIIYSSYALSPDEVYYIHTRPFPNVKKFLASN